MRVRHVLSSLLVLAALFALPLAARGQDATPVATGTATVIAGDLTNPRGFGWGPDGTLYLALAGHGGDTQIAAAPGFTIDIGLTSSVVTVANGCVAPVAVGLLSAKWDEPDWVWGAMDVAFLDGTPYVLVSGAGPSWGSPTSRSGVYRLEANGGMTLVADLTTWLPQHPPTFVAPDIGWDGSLFDLEPAGDALLLSIADIGYILRVAPATGAISVVADLSEGHLVPTGLAVDDQGNAYVGYETTPPYETGMSKITKIAPDGTVSDAWTGLTRVADVALGPDGVLYAVELSTDNTDTAPFVHAGTGRVVKQTGADGQAVVADGLDFPVGLGFGPDGALYVDGPANGSDAGGGWLARIDQGLPAANAAPTACAAATPAA